MATQVDTRKLKDQAAELLGKHKYDKAAELFEQLSRVEPRDMQHRLKLGDTYRRLGVNDKAINAFQIAGRQFGEEGQLIKAIGAFKVILEIDPKNEAAQKELAQMNQRRFAKPSPEAAGPVGSRPPKGIGAGARATSELELAEGEKAAAGVGAIFESGGRTPIEMSEDGGDDAPLELDVPGRPTPARATQPAMKPAVLGKVAPVPPKIRPEERRGPPPRLRPSIELGGGTSDPGLHGHEAALDPDELDPADLEPLDELEALDVDMPAPKPPPAPTPSPAWRGAQSPSPKIAPIAFPPKLAAAPAAFTSSAGMPQARVKPPEPEAIELGGDDEFDLEIAPARPSWRGSPSQTPAAGAPAQYMTPKSSAGWKPVPARPIADLLTASDEIELISLHTSDPGKPKAPATPSAPAAQEAPRRPLPGLPDAATKEELDAAFDSISPPAHKLPAKVPLFDDLPHDAFVELVNRLSFKRRSPGELILKEGEPGRSFFVIVQGKVRVFKTRPDGGEVGLARLGEGAFFGEMALLSGAPRTANVVAEEETELLEISDQMLREIVQHYPSVAQSLKNFYRQRLVNNVMATSPMFNEFDPMERRAVVERFRMRQASANEVLIREGQGSDGLYVVLHGGVRVAKKTDAGEVELARLREGELFGEMSLLSNEPASATVSALGPTILLKLPADQFQELILTHPQILEMVSDLTDKRRSATDQVLQDHGPGHDGMSFV